MSDLAGGSTTPEVVKQSAEALVNAAVVKDIKIKPENNFETKEGQILKNEPVITTPEKKVEISVPKPSKVASKTPIAKDEVDLRVEQILSDGLNNLYADLPENAKPIFKAKGEETAAQIAVMVRTFKFEVSKVIRLIRNWLLTIPKVNRFFLEQEAKIKTDSLVEYIQTRQDELSK